MDFCNLESFNLALLEKQLWHIIFKPGSLVAWIFKKKYFKNGDIMKAMVRGDASLIWRNLTVARVLLIQGPNGDLGTKLV